MYETPRLRMGNRGLKQLGRLTLYQLSDARLVGR